MTYSRAQVFWMMITNGCLVLLATLAVNSWLPPKTYQIQSGDTVIAVGSGECRLTGKAVGFKIVDIKKERGK